MGRVPRSLRATPNELGPRQLVPQPNLNSVRFQHAGQRSVRPVATLTDRMTNLHRLMATLLIVAALTTGPGASRGAAVSCGNSAQPTMSVYLPNITKMLGGPDGWVTPFIVQNVGTVATTLEISFYRFSDGALLACRQVPNLRPGTSFADFPNNDTDLPADTQFSVVVRSFGAAIVSVVNEHQGLSTPVRNEALSYVGLSSGANTLALPYVAKLVNGWLVTFVVQNLGPSNANVTARFTSYDGTKTAIVSRLIGPGASRFVDPRVEPALVAGTEYSVTLTADQPIAAIANAHNDAAGVPAPMGFSYNAVATTPLPQVYVPSVARNADGIARTTRVVVQNTGAFDAVPTLSFQRIGAGQVNVTAPAPVRPGVAWTFDPRFLADGRTPCPAQGAPGCVGEGEWGLVVSGGTFAVLAMSLSPSTALGFIGTAAPGNRAYLPNVTRTLGGANGWTTPIVLQSAGATSATLRWYRFSDGSLVTRQNVFGLVPGSSVRVDPRSIGGLTDDTQYAIVVDGQGGNVVAMVMEFAFFGGDGAMAYEGFKATVDTTPVPATIVVTPTSASVATSATAQFTAAVKDQFDNPSQTTVSWSVTPPTLGTITPAGLFTAGGAFGSGTVTATAGTIMATASVTIVPPTTTTVGGITFKVDAAGPADVYTQTSISSSDSSSIVVQVNADVTAVQTDLGRRFAARPKVYVMTTTSSYGTAMQTIFGYSAAQAQQIATNSQGVFVAHAAALAANWQGLSRTKPVTTLRHELTHMMEHQIAANVDSVAWFNEGNANIEEFTIAGDQWDSMLSRYGASSMAATNTLLSFAEITSRDLWNARAEPALTNQYYQSTQLVQLLRNDVGQAGVLRILELMGTGQSFESAYAAQAGRPFSAFASGAATRLRAIAPSHPGVATATDNPLGAGLSFELFGFVPSSQVTVFVSGPASSTPRTVTVSSIGTYFNYLDSSWPPGTYTVSATSSGGTVTATGTHSVQGVGSVFFDAGTDIVLEFAAPL